MNKRIVGLLGCCVLMLAGCKRYTWVLSPHAKRLVVDRVRPEHACATHEKDGVRVLVQKLPDDAVKAVFGQQPAVGYALTIDNHSKTTITVDRTHITAPLVAHDTIIKQFSVQATLHESYFPLGPLMAVIPIATAPVYHGIMSNVYHSAEAVGFATIAYVPFMALIVAVVYGIIVACDHEQPPPFNDFLATIVLDRLVLRSHEIKTRLVFFERSVSGFSLVFTCAGERVTIPLHMTNTRGDVCN